MSFSCFASQTGPPPCTTRPRGNPLTLMPYWFKLNGQSKWASITHFDKTTDAKADDDDVGSTIGGLAPATRVAKSMGEEIGG